MLHNYFLENSKEKTFPTSFPLLPALDFISFGCFVKENNSIYTEKHYQLNTKLVVPNVAIFLVTLSTVAQMSSTSWEPDRGAHIQQTEASCFTS